MSFIPSTPKVAGCFRGFPNIQYYHMTRDNVMLHLCGAFITWIAAQVISYCILRVATLHAYEIVVFIDYT